MLAYNQFSGNVALQGPGMGGFGRKGAQRLVILETDGLANVATSAGVTNGGPYMGNFNVGLANSYSASSTDPNIDAINVAQSDLCDVQRFELRSARLFDDHQAGLDPVHRLRRIL